MSSNTLTTRGGLGRFNDLLLAGLVVAVIVMMALPLPPWMLDVLVAVNISAGIVLLLIALYVPTPLAFSTFPSVLLITTLFRISLNVATTRQILLHAHAGDIIDAFGRLVVGGSLVVGLVVFLIITVVQFIVVAKGAERVAEVGARFTLDALPGKQMSIDSDMRSGIITQAEALARRQELMLESQFYGAMDGAMKFVKGDAIAGIVIVLVNLLGGIAIGALVLDMTFGDAVQRYSVLSIGDGLVTQIPALFVSIAAGIAITRTAPDSSAASTNLGDQVAKQLGAQPKALILSAMVMALFAAVPGFPTFTFLTLAAMVGGLGVALSRRQAATSDESSRLAVAAAAREGETAPIYLQEDLPPGRPPSPFKLAMGEALVARITAPGLDDALRRERTILREHYGIPFPGLALQQVATLHSQGFTVSVQDLVDTSLVIPDGMVLVLGHPSHEKLVALGESVEHAVPALLKPCRWVEQNQASELEGKAGLEVLDGAGVIARTVVRVMQKNSVAVMGVQEVRQLLKEIEGRFADLVREAQTILPLPRLADLMAALTRERVPLTDLPALLQAIVTEGPSGVSDSGAFYEATRMALARGIVARQLATRPQIEGASDTTASNRLGVIALDSAFEARLRAGITIGPTGATLALPPPVFEAAQKSLQAAFEAASAREITTLVLPVDLRRAVSRLFRGVLPRVAFISHEELLASDVLPDPIPVSLPPGLAGV